MCHESNVDSGYTLSVYKIYPFFGAHQRLFLFLFLFFGDYFLFLFLFLFCLERVKGRPLAIARVTLHLFIAFYIKN